MNPRLLLFAILPLAALASPAQAQFRSGQPDALAPAPAPRDPRAGVVQAFGSAYRRAGSPRIVVFWNRAFDDEVASEFEDREVEHEVTDVSNHGIEQTTSGPSGQTVRREGGELTERMRETTLGTKRVKPAARARQGGETVDWQLEDGFSAALGEAGVRLVDRGMVMRLTGMDTGIGERGNVQELETRGMSRYADIVLEVLAAPDSRASRGAAYRIVARDLRTARPLGSFTTTATPPTPHLGFVAGPNGFVRETAPTPGPGQVGRQLGLETLAILAGAM